MERIIIGISGGTGSGKTTLAKKICKAIGEDALLLGMDCYYKNHPDMPYDERAKINYDHPDAFDSDLFVNHLETLKRGGKIVHPTYDFSQHLRSDVWVEIESKRVIIVEGILLFADKRIVDNLDVKIYVDTDADVRIIRRIMRDVKERGRSLDSIVNQYLSTVKPMHEQFIEPSKRVADVIVPEGGYNMVAFDMICSTILKKLND